MTELTTSGFWLVRRVDGKQATVVEVKQALAGQGASKVQVVQDAVLEALGIEHGIRVEFPQWDQSRDLRRVSLMRASFGVLCGRYLTGCT
jgi:hypothetical protein